ncbi:MAG: hypothetical protein J6K55_17160 [Clostridia bacterium]|nr:hypothetical protein [Clostridia bacterium]
MAALFGENVKTAILKGIEALGKGASTLAEGAQKKLDEINLETRRREILNEIPKCVNELYQQGIELPEQLMGLLTELAELDEKLESLRPQPAPAAEPAAQETEEPCECCAEEACSCGEETCDCGCEEAAQEETVSEEPAEVQSEED